MNLFSLLDVNRFDHGATNNYSVGFSTASDWLVAGLIASPMLILTKSTVRSDWRTYLIMYAETMVLTGLSAQLAKGTFQRTRPFVYNPDAPIDPKLETDARKSFYSSHTSFAFASAVSLSTTFGAYFPRPPVQAYLLDGSLLAPTTVGAMRYGAGPHFPTDIRVGAAIGSAFGWFVPLATVQGPAASLSSHQ